MLRIKIVKIFGATETRTLNLLLENLAPVYFSPNYKYFDQLLQTVKSKTTVLIIVFKEFLQSSIPPLISVLYAKGYHDFPLKNFVEDPVSVSENFGYRKTLCLRGEYHDFL